MVLLGKRSRVSPQELAGGRTWGSSGWVALRVLGATWGPWGCCVDMDLLPRGCGADTEGYAADLAPKGLV